MKPYEMSALAERVRVLQSCVTWRVDHSITDHIRQTRNQITGFSPYRPSPQFWTAKIDSLLGFTSAIPVAVISHVLEAGADRPRTRRRRR